jgi:hypothetical protein
VELVPYNLCDYSEDQTQWTSQDETTVTANSTTAPNGTLTADTVTPTAVNTDHYRGIVLSSQVGELTAFIYVKPNGYNFFDWGIWNGSQYLVRATFDLVNLTYTFTNAGTATIESVGNGWLKCGISGSNASLSTIALYYRVRPTGGTGGFTGNGTSGAFIWGAQLNIGSTAKDYQKTETRLNIPRLDYSNGTCPSLLVEPQRTNIATYSEDFSNAVWTKNQSTITSNYAVSPQGIQNASRWLSNSGATLHFLSQLYGFTLGVTYTISCYVKSNTSSNQDFRLGIDGGVTSSNLTATTEWQRFTFTANPTNAVGLTAFFIARPSTNAAVDLLIYGLQLEVGSYPTSYIPTTSASVTRNADVISKTGISSLIGQTEGVVFLDFEYKNLDTGGLIPIFLSNTSANQFYLIITTNERMIADYYFSDATQASISTATGFAQPNTRYKIAMAYKANDFAFYINGQLIGTDSSGSVSGLNDLALNYLFGSNYGPTGQNINSIALWKTRLTNTQLAQLTTI